MKDVQIKKYFFMVFAAWTFVLAAIPFLESSALVESSAPLLQRLKTVGEDVFRAPSYKILIHSAIWLLGSLGIIAAFYVLSRAMKDNETISRRKLSADLQLKYVWEHSQDGMRTVDGEGIILNVNQAYCAIAELSKKELIGKHFSVVYFAASKHKQNNEHRHRMTSKISGRHEEELELWNGEKKWMEVSHSYYFDEYANADKLLSFFRNITERKTAERELTLLAHTVKSVQDIVTITDINDRIIFVNKFFENEYGFTADEVIGKPVSFLREGIYQNVNIHTIAEETIKGSWHGELLNTKKDGKEFILELWASSVKDNNGQIIAMVSVGRNITERKISETKLKKSEEKFSRIFNSSPDAITISAIDSGEYIEVNQGFEKISGYAKNEVLGKTTIELEIWKRAEDRAKLVQTITQQGALQNHEFEFRKKNGESITALVSAEIVEIENKICLLSIVRDISERKAMELEQQRLIDELKEAIANVKTLSGLIPICSNCKKIRDDNGYWDQIEHYITAHSDAMLSHGVCPDCIKHLYPEHAEKILSRK